MNRYRKEQNKKKGTGRPLDVLSSDYAQKHTKIQEGLKDYRNDERIDPEFYDMLVQRTKSWYAANSCCKNVDTSFIR